MDSVDEFLKGPEAIEEETPETVETPETPEVAEEPKGPERDEHGRFKPKGDKEAEPAPQPAQSATPAPEEQHAPIKALQEERRKRQEVESQLAEVLNRLNAQPQPAPEPLPSIFEDENGYTQQILAQARRQIMSEIAPQLQQQTRATLIEVKRQAYRETRPDFAELEAQLFEELPNNPALAQQLSTAEDPVEFGYRYMKNKKEVSQLGSLDLEAIKAQLREQIKAEMVAAPVTATPEIPTSLADAQSARSGPAAGAPLTLDAILGRK